MGVANYTSGLKLDDHRKDIYATFVTQSLVSKADNYQRKIEMSGVALSFIWECSCPVS